jgi:nucleoside-diphosphate-sugar epimerase
MRTVVITGAAGFLGSYLSKEMLKHGYRVVGFDNFFRGKEENLPNHNNFSFFELDLVNQKDELKKIVNKEKPEIVIHYAAINGTKYFYDIPYQVIDNNIRMTQNLLEACKLSSIKKIVYSSSSEIYGEPLKIPTPETHPILLNIFTNRDSYASSKAICDFYVKLFAEKNKKDYLIFRIFNTYGPNMDTSEYGQVIPELIEKMYSKQKFTIIGDGSQTRSFCYVSDHTRLARKLIENASNEIVNLGNDKEIKIFDLARMMHVIDNIEFKPIYLPGREYDHKRRRPDITKMKNLINDYPKISLEKGLKLTIKEFKHRI